MSFEVLEEAHIEALVAELWPAPGAASAGVWDHAADRLSGAAAALAHLGTPFCQLELVYLAGWVARQRATFARRDAFNRMAMRVAA